MNTPKTRKRNTRFNRQVAHMLARDDENDDWTWSVQDPEFLRHIGHAVTLWPMLEDTFVTVLANLLGGTGHEVATEIFHALVAQNTRLPILNALLQNTVQNADKPDAYDEVIDEFKRLNDKRNEFIHSYWVTNDKTKKVYLCPSKRTVFVAIADGRVIELEEILTFILDCLKLHERITTSGEFPRPPTFQQKPPVQ